MAPDSHRDYALGDGACLQSDGLHHLIDGLPGTANIVRACSHINAVAAHSRDTLVCDASWTLALGHSKQSESGDG